MIEVMIEGEELLERVAMPCWKISISNQTNLVISIRREEFVFISRYKEVLMKNLVN
jgi:hypothetical protein